MAVPPYNIAESVPGDSDIVAQFPFAERSFRDIVESWLNQIADATTGYSKIPTDTTTNLTALTQPIGGTRYDTTRSVLQVKTGTSTWVDVGFPKGTIAIFVQETAPPGWTKITDTEVNAAIIELVTGSTGGDYVGSTAIAAATLTQAMLPSVNLVSGTETTVHIHTGVTDIQGAHQHTPSGGGSFGTNRAGGVLGAATASFAADALTNSAGAHGHNVTTGGQSALHQHIVPLGGSGSAYLSDVKRVRAILCVKD